MLRAPTAVGNLLQRTVLAACLKSNLEAKETDFFKEFITTTLNPLGTIFKTGVLQKSILLMTKRYCNSPSLKSKLLVTKFVASII